MCRVDLGWLVLRCFLAYVLGVEGEIFGGFGLLKGGYCRFTLKLCYNIRCVWNSGVSWWCSGLELGVFRNVLGFDLSGGSVALYWFARYDFRFRVW